MENNNRSITQVNHETNSHGETKNKGVQSGTGRNQKERQSNKEDYKKKKNTSSK
jgi:hypothetical protein